MVDRIVFDILDYYTSRPLEEIIHLLEDEYDSNSIIEAYGEIKELEKEGLLFSEDVDTAILNTIRIM